PPLTIFAGRHIPFKTRHSERHLDLYQTRRLRFLYAANGFHRLGPLALGQKTLGVFQMRAARRIEPLHVRRRQRDRPIKDLPDSSSGDCDQQQQCSCEPHALAYPSMNRPIAKMTTPKTIITSIVLTVNPAPVAAREPVVICSIIDTGRITSPIT